jgi:homoserine acetyltransferase
VLALLDDLDIKTTHVLGTSLGGVRSPEASAGATGLGGSTGVGLH